MNKNEFNYSDYNKVNNKPANTSYDFNNTKNGKLKHSKNPFRYLFKSKRNQNSYGEINDQDCSTFKRTKTLDYKTKSKLIFFESALKELKAGKQALYKNDVNALNEVQILRDFEHEHIIKYIDCFEDQFSYAKCIVFELCEVVYFLRTSIFTIHITHKILI